MSKINYQYGVEYATNGKKPDLPDDVIVNVSVNGKWKGGEDPSDADAVWTWNWANVTEFCIVDNRYKPKTDQPTQPKDDWFVRGDFPPAGTRCEVLSGVKWHKTFIVGMNGKYCVYDSKGFEPYNYNGESNPAFFRPLKTERERFIELASKIMHQTEGGAINDISLAQLFDAGFRAPQ